MELIIFENMDFSEPINLLITGGTGSFGRAFIQNLIDNYKNVNRLVIFSRDELKQWELRNKYPIEKYPFIRYFLGDIRDKSRIKRALNGIDIVVHAAALKQVPTAEYNPMEFIKTNIYGAHNLIEACLDSNVKKVIALSTDKAAAPINLYGASKLCSDKLFVSANNIVGKSDQNFSIIRYGNVMGSRGSVIPLFIESAKKGKLFITDPKMTRFNISLIESVEMVLWAIKNSIGGEIFVPKIPSFKISDVADAISTKCEKIITGIRPGEKLHEEMITEADGINTLDLGNYYAITPDKEKFMKKYKRLNISFKQLNEGFFYRSDTNSKFLNINEIRELILKNVDPYFSPII